MAILANSNISYDFQVSFTRRQLPHETTDNYTQSKSGSTERPGLSVFSKDDHDVIFHADSCDARGLVMLNGAYQHLDLVAKGRDEAGFPRPMDWVRLHDQYGG